MVATCINAACLALLDASVPLSFLLAAVTVAVTADGELLVDPTLKQARYAAQIFGITKIQNTDLETQKRSAEI